MPNPRRRLPGPGGGTAKNVLTLWAIILLLAAAQPQSANNVLSVLQRQQQLLSSTVQEAVPHSSRRPSPGRSPAEIPLINLDTTTIQRKSSKYTEDASGDADTFLAIAPADRDAAVRAPLAKKSESSGLSSLTAARSLQDWEVENIVLLATIDGAIHARDRKTGRERWALVLPDSPMIETIHHRQNRSKDDLQGGDEDYIFIVEPSKDGQLYIQFSDARKGLQKLDATVKSLEANTPQMVEDPPLTYIAQKETKMYTVDAATGDVLRQFDRHGGKFVNDKEKQSCQRVSGFELDQAESEPMGTLNLGRVEYTINMFSAVSQDLLCTIKFSEWTPNTRDVDLQSQHVAPLDRCHIQSFHDGRITGWDLDSQAARAPRFTHVLETPVARIFDVVRPADDRDRSASLTVLAQPTDVTNGRLAQQWDDAYQQSKVYVNQTELGHWYVMSELSYPGVTTSATLAKRFAGGFGEHEPLDFTQDMDDLVGVHVLKSPLYGTSPVQLTISGPTPGSEVALPPESEVAQMTPKSSDLDPSSMLAGLSGTSWVVLVMLFVVMVFCIGLRKKQKLALEIQGVLHKIGFPIFVGVDNTKPATSSTLKGKEGGEIIPVNTVEAPPPGSGALHAQSRAASPSRGLDLDANHERKQSEPGVTSEANEVSSDGESDEDSKRPTSGEGHSQENGEAEPKKRKAKRGRRGGKNNKRKNKSMAPEALDGDQFSVVDEVRLSDDMVQVGKLKVDQAKDRCLGHGSNGTVVFPGQLDGRDVAVKRLIRSSNSLAAKEIKHLLSSDENQHVIRYFGKEESQYFTYIALDLFTSSLDQVVERPEKFPMLVTSPEGLDVKDALRQITDGVQHLHSLKLVHRDIKPQNVLVRATKSSRPATGPPKLQYVISDFGLCKPLDEGPESTFAQTANRTAAGTTGWRAPELLVDPRAPVAAPLADGPASRSTTHSSEGTVVDPSSGRRATKAIDIFSLGCVFYYILTQGMHPFDVGGTSLGRDLNIKENRKSTDGLRLHQYSYEGEDLILQMLAHNPSDRPDTTLVLDHPFFWDVEDKIDFLCLVSDNYEHEKIAAEKTGISDEMVALNGIAKNVIGPSHDFLKALPRNFTLEAKNRRGYEGSKMVDLLRLFRNKKVSLWCTTNNINADCLTEPLCRSASRHQGNDAGWQRSGLL